MCVVGCVCGVCGAWVCVCVCVKYKNMNFFSCLVCHLECDVITPGNQRFNGCY